MSQLVRLAAACGRYSEMVLFTGLTGLRWGEVSTLRARHFDEGGTGEEATIFIDRAVAKTDEERVVPVPEMLAKALASRLALCSPDDLIFPSPMGRVLDDKNFRNRQFNPAARAAAEAVATLARALGVTAGRRRAEYDGRAFPVASFNEPMREALNSWQAEHGLPEVDHTTPALWDSIAAGVADEELAALCRRLRLTHLKPGDVDFLKPEFHDLRRTAVSLALAEGASVKAVQRFVGHSSVTMTLEVYADVVGDQVEGVARALGNSLGRVAGLEEALTSAS
jgi:integrase